MILFFIGLLITSGVMVFGNWRKRTGYERQEILRFWEEGSYEDVFNITQEKLQSRPLDYFLLISHGMASYQLAVAQINHSDTLIYIDECIWSLRKALLVNKAANDGRIPYVLGKAYYEKGTGYADLAVNYLEKAREVSYNARDVPEYLGLAYARIHNYHNSIVAFTLALNPVHDSKGNDAAGGLYPEGAVYPQDLLLLSIARSYLELNESGTATAYLQRCIETSRDSQSIVTARFLLGGVLENSGDKEGAEIQYLTIIEEAGENAEAHYRLGELYASMGDTTRSRFEWRTAMRIDPTHKQARIRLNI
ncbi:MAG: tetratricopeptide repeat protein [Spirochaetaceae bacterium]|jgi:tetratricopeptide (TPR) repeat protein|nr:tetratricopeptide repeat protein [Spirochaetaceae bacterium]